MPNRCATCGHVWAIHDPSGACPRWAAIRGLDVGTRVCIRIAHKWTDAEGHVIAFFADCVDPATEMVLVWDLTADKQFEAPMITVRGPWTRAPTTEEKANAADALELALSEKVSVIRNLS